MSSHIPVWDSTHLELDDEGINFDNPYEPWKNVTKLNKNCDHFHQGHPTDTT